jgi:hypothetical protein
MARIAVLFVVIAGLCGSVVAEVRSFVGVVGGVATLSADGRSQQVPQGIDASLYKPENGPALNLFAGAHLTQYVSVQANYIWNRNDLMLTSTSPESNSFYEEQRNSSQHALIFDLLVYFRQQKSRVRPYLSGGTGLVYFSSSEARILTRGGSTVLPPARFSSTRPALRVAVGMDVLLNSKLDFRYSFSETIRHNEISAELSPPARRGLANFQNLFGIVVRF